MNLEDEMLKPKCIAVLFNNRNIRLVYDNVPLIQSRPKLV